MSEHRPRFSFEVPEGLPDEWRSRDLPVLRAVAHKLTTEGRGVRVTDLAFSVEDEDSIEAALVALDGVFIDCVRLEGSLADIQGELMAVRLTERGRRAVGLWPSADSADVLVDALRQAEDLVEDPEERNMIRRAAGAVGAVSRDVMVDVVAAVVARQSGIG